MTHDDVTTTPIGSFTPDLSLEQRLLLLEAETAALCTAHARFDARGVPA